MNGGEPLLRQSDSDIASAAIDHVRLSYHYLDADDIDGYGSLFEEWAVLLQPGFEPVYGRAELERFERTRWNGRRPRHVVFEVFGSGRRVAVFGRVVPAPGGGAGDAGIDFMDLFQTADHGLLAGRRSFYFTPAGL